MILTDMILRRRLISTDLQRPLVAELLVARLATWRSPQHRYFGIGERRLAGGACDHFERAPQLRLGSFRAGACERTTRRDRRSERAISHCSLQEAQDPRLRRFRRRCWAGWHHAVSAAAVAAAAAATAAVAVFAAVDHATCVDHACSGVRRRRRRRTGQRWRCARLRLLLVLVPVVDEHVAIVCRQLRRRQWRTLVGSDDRRRWWRRRQPRVRSMHTKHGVGEGRAGEGAAAAAAAPLRVARAAEPARARTRVSRG